MNTKLTPEQLSSLLRKPISPAVQPLIKEIPKPKPIKQQRVSRYQRIHSIITTSDTALSILDVMHLYYEIYGETINNTNVTNDVRNMNDIASIKLKRSQLRYISTRKIFSILDQQELARQKNLLEK